MLISGCRRPQPTSKKNRCLVLPEVSGCPLWAFFLTHPPFLVGRVILKHFLFHSYFLLFLSIYILLDVFIWLFNLNSVIAYSVKV